MNLLLLIFLLYSIIADVRSATARKDFTRAEGAIQAYRAQNGVTPEMLEALSWLGRGALAAKDLDKADGYAVETRKLALEQLKKRKLDDEQHLPIALGASIEVQAHVLAARGQRSEAVSFLRRELETYRGTSIRTRIQKNIHLLSLEGKPAPALEIAQWLGPKPAPIEQFKGHPVLMFFWAHWCGDCKDQAPALAKLMSAYGPKGLVLIGPTQRYGYTARGQEADSDQETHYIDEIRKKYYAPLGDMPVPVSEDNFRNYGASTTPTLVLLDRNGLVRLYHPGAMPYGELAARVETTLAN
jgi:thiol-disulfide isomerase/thioredoxin